MKPISKHIFRCLIAVFAFAFAFACAPAAFAIEVHTLPGDDATTSPRSVSAKGAADATPSVAADHTIQVAGSGTNYAATLDEQQIASGDFFTAVQGAFDYVREHDDGTLWSVVVEQGVHELGDKCGLAIYSNTILDCRAGVTIYAGDPPNVTAGGLIIRAGRSNDSTTGFVQDAGGYDDYTNIYIVGGTFYGHPKGKNPATLANKGYKGCNIRFGHASGIHILGATFKNNVGAHHVELGAVQNCEIIDCSFSGSYGSGSIEALQLDITHRHKENFDSYWPYDDLPTIDTIVKDCLFTDVTRGVGSHHLILGANYNKITIQNNTFTNIADRAIAAGNFTNSLISGNMMTNVNSGIYATNMIPGQTYLKIDDTSYAGSKTLAMNLKIINNTIGVKNSGTYPGMGTKYGIRAGGAEVTNGSYIDYKTTYTDGTYGEQSVKKNLPTDKYYVSGLTISGNTITGGVGNITAGLLFDYLSGSKIENNTVSAGNFNIEVKNSVGVETINNNTLSNPGSHCLYAYMGSTIKSISGNTINNSAYHGISVRDNAKVATVSNNKVDNSAQNGINLESQPNVAVTGNKVSNSKMTGIVVKGSNKAKVSSNTSTGNKKFGIWVDGSANANISSNTVKQSTDVGIFVSGSDNSTVSGNHSSSTINATTKFEIVVNGSTGTKITGNKLGTRRFKEGNHVPIIASSLPAGNISNNAAWARLWGSNALDTMTQITKTYGKASVAVVATNASFKDSLAAAALAGGLNAPMLTTSKGGLSAQTKSELKRMGVKTVYLVGNTGDVAEKVVTQMKSAGVKTVTRISGANPAAKAINCAKKVKGRSDTVIIATQNNFKDALAISSYAYASKSPILYAESNKKLSSATVNYIKSGKFKKAIIVGGPVALPTSIETQLKSAGIAAGSITRLAGSNQYKTAQVIAEWAVGKLKNGTGGGSGLYQYAQIKFQPTVKLSANKLGVARADDNKIGWKDALAGAALCGKNKSVILLADSKNDANATDFVQSNKAPISNGYVFGGTLAVPYASMEKLISASR